MHIVSAPDDIGNDRDKPELTPTKPLMSAVGGKFEGWVRGSCRCCWWRWWWRRGDDDGKGDDGGDDDGGDDDGGDDDGGEEMMMA